MRRVTAEPAMPSEDVEPGAGQRFLDLAKRLVAVPKEELDRLRHHDEDGPQAE